MMDKSTINARMKTMPKGFRFHPTDEELLCHYLKLKLDGKNSQVQNVISEVDICKYDAWDLPSKSAVESEDNEWFFFSPCNYKYEKSKRLSRTTDRGYWKPTGEIRKVKAKGKVIGKKKNLGYHVGKFPHGKSTNWVIHEYHSLETHPNQKKFVLCRLKKNPGKNFDKGSPSGEAETPTPKDQYQLEGDLRALVGLGSPQQRDLMPPSSQLKQQELKIVEHQIGDGISSDYNGPENPSDMEEDEIDITEFLDPAVFEQGEGSEVTLTKCNQVQDLCMFAEPAFAAKNSSFCLIEASPSAHGLDHLKQRHENEFEKSNGLSDDSYADTPGFIL